MRSHAVDVRNFAWPMAIVHFATSFGMTLAGGVALVTHSQETTNEAFSIVGLYATTAALAFITFFASIYRAPKDQIRARFRAFNWILAAQASFMIQAVIAYGLVLFQTP